MGRVQRLRIENYRSIQGAIEIAFPSKAPLVLIGENNAGKSNIVRALDLVLGEMWPGSYEPDDHEFFGRDRNEATIGITIDLDGVHHTDYNRTHIVSQLAWQFPTVGGRALRMVYAGGGGSSYVSNEVRGQCTCILIGADRRLSYQLSYTSKYTFLSKLMKRFHERLTADPERMAQLQGYFAAVKTLFEGVSEFAAFQDELRQQVAELSGNLAYSLGIDFSAYDPSNYFHALQVYPQENKQVRTFDELGTGQEQILAVSFAQAYARAFRDAGGLVLVIEEPEAHLHPLAQEWMGQKIFELAEQGVQVVVTTHSPAFLDVMHLEGFVLVRKEGAATSVVQLTRSQLAEHCQKTGAPKTTSGTVLPFYAAVSTAEILAGFFARKIVLVEGPTEALALPTYLAHVGLDPTREGIAIIPVHGVGNLAKWYRLFSAYGIPTYVIFDNDAKDDKVGTKRRDILQTLGVDPAEYSRLLSTDEWVVTDQYCVFGTDYEKTMRTYFPDAYSALEAEAHDQFGLSADQSKPLVARHVAERLALAGYPVGLKQLKQVAWSICHLGEPDELPF
ncbi:MAG: AAA family ATPase [Chloroflexi bacterium]|nr:AAA family ATPase [Chloroflexota bacterium]